MIKWTAKIPGSIYNMLYFFWFKYMFNLCEVKYATIKFNRLRQSNQADVIPDKDAVPVWVSEKLCGNHLNTPSLIIKCMVCYAIMEILDLDVALYPL